MYQTFDISVETLHRLDRLTKFLGVKGRSATLEQALEMLENITAKFPTTDNIVTGKIPDQMVFFPMGSSEKE